TCITGVAHLGGLWFVVLGCAILLLLGVFDDRQIVRSGRKFAIQSAVALLIVWGEASGIAAVGHATFGAAPWADAASMLIAWLFVVGFINALNMVDGVDGLAGSLVLSMSVAFLLVGGSAN